MLAQVSSSAFKSQWYGGSLIISCPFAFAKSCSVFKIFVAVMLAQISSSGFKSQWYGGSLIISCPFAFAKSSVLYLNLCGCDVSPNEFLWV